MHVIITYIKHMNYFNEIHHHIHAKIQDKIVQNDIMC